MNESKLDIELLKGKCSCGKEHNISLEGVFIEENASKHLKILKEKYKNIVAVYDTNTYKAAGIHIKNNIEAKSIILNANNLHADQKAVQALEESLENIKSDVLIAAGSGTIHDIVRFVANKKDIDFVSYPTAPSVDGFVSSVAAMTWFGFKKTMPAKAPKYLFADISVIKTASKKLINAGIGDLLGKYTALADWKISNIILDEYLCEKTYNTMSKAVNQCVDNIDLIIQKDTKGLTLLTNALVLSGLAMQLMGNSRPASGAEHHLSHLWEMAVINKPIDAYHGEKVGVATLYLINLYKQFFNNKSFTNQYKGINKKVINDNFNQYSEEITQENKTDLLLNISLEKLNQNIDSIKKVIEEIPEYNEILDIYKKAELKINLNDIDLKEDILNSSFDLAPYVRVRPTLLRIISLIY